MELQKIKRSHVILVMEVAETHTLQKKMEDSFHFMRVQPQIEYFSLHYAQSTWQLENLKM